MKKNKILLIIFALITFTACKKNNTTPPKPSVGTFIDYGFIPFTDDKRRIAAGFQTAIFNNNYVFVGTTDGVWKNDLNTKIWSRAGLEGKTITAIYKHPTIANKFFVGVASDNTATSKTLFISNNGGLTWDAGNNLVFDNVEKRYEDYVCFAVHPSNPNLIFANLAGGATIAISVDGGLNWVRNNNRIESYFGYPCAIVFLPSDANTIYQGAETPLDFAWLGKYDIDATNPVLLNNYTKIIDHDIWGNRRPNELQTNSYTDNSIYVGQEGALSKVTGNTTKFIYKSANNNLPYSYIYAIWVDPLDTKHLLFGGAEQVIENISLYETYDEGVTIKRFTDKMGFDFPVITEIVATNTYPAIIINDNSQKKVKMYLYKP